MKMSDKHLIESLSAPALRQLAEQWRVEVGDCGMSEEDIIEAVEAMFDDGPVPVAGLGDLIDVLVEGRIDADA